MQTDRLLQKVRLAVKSAVDALALAEQALNKRQADIVAQHHELDERVVETGKQLDLQKAQVEEQISTKLQEMAVANERQQSEAFKGKDRVVLNVGGSVFETSKATLMTDSGSFFHAMVHSGAWAPDETGQFFIDRDPQFVREILNYLRKGQLDGKMPNLSDPGTLPPNDVEFLVEQLDFFQIDSLLAVFRPNDPQPTPTIKEEKTGPQFCAFGIWKHNPSYFTSLNASMNAAARAVGGKRAATLTQYTSSLIQGLPTAVPAGGPCVFTHGGKTIVAAGQPLDGHITPVQQAAVTGFVVAVR
eukprot:TRINITY_DN51883_c0_g1_i1.p1 TRINITY_DN51883_c0_g1~~TRINITY_DN51883_c0_g1_i1.p1  ORF type:complete len:301 (-),score=38.05 TRINITY_DN51883_c0_g1_i1:733-1635(-)